MMFTGWWSPSSPYVYYWLLNVLPVVPSTLRILLGFDTIKKYKRIQKLIFPELNNMENKVGLSTVEQWSPSWTYSKRTARKVKCGSVKFKCANSTRIIIAQGLILLAQCKWSWRRCWREMGIGEARCRQYCQFYARQGKRSNKSS